MSKYIENYSCSITDKCGNIRCYHKQLKEGASVWVNFQDPSQKMLTKDFIVPKLVLINVSPTSGTYIECYDFMEEKDGVDIQKNSE